MVLFSLGKLLLTFASTVILGFRPYGTNDQVFVHSKTTYVFGNSA
jgi:hypothetical protein